MKFLLASLLLVYAVHSLPRFYLPLGDLKEYIGDDDDNDGGFEIDDESDDDDSLFENGKSRKSSRNFGVREKHIIHDGNWKKPKKIEEMSQEELDEFISKAMRVLFGSKKKAKPSEQPTEEHESTEGFIWGKGKLLEAAEHPPKDGLKKFQKSNVRKISEKDFDTDPTSPPFNPYLIGLEDDDDYLTSDDDLHTPEDIFPISDILDLPIFREDQKPKSQQSKSARRGGYVRKGLAEDVIDIIINGMPEMPEMPEQPIIN